MEKFYIDQVTLQVTTKCNKNYSCLRGSGEDICPVEYSMNQGISFVQCAQETKCSYRTSYGDSYICLCPVRNEIYNKYSV